MNILSLVVIPAFLNTCNAVTPANGIEEDSLKFKFFGFKAINDSHSIVYSAIPP